MKNNDHNSKDKVQDTAVLPRVRFLNLKRSNETLTLVLVGAAFAFWGGFSFAFSKYEYLSFKNVNIVRAPTRNVVLAEKKEADIEELLFRKEETSSFISSAQANIPDNQLLEATKSIIKKNNSLCSTLGGHNDEKFFANRATILDSRGDILAMDVEKSALEFQMGTYVFQDNQERHDFANMIANIIPSKNLKTINEALKRQKGYVSIAKNLSPSQVKALRLLPNRFSPIIQIRKTNGRIYPKGALFAHFVGQVRSDRCPVSGVEKKFHERLTISDEPLQLSLEEGHQFILVEEMMRAINMSHAEGAMGMVVDLKTGQIRAMASLPDFDPNSRNYLSNHYPHEYKKRSKNLYTEGYELGSVLKIFNTLLALENGVGLNEVYETNKPFRLGRYLIPEPYPSQANLNVIGIFLRSNNRGSARMALNIGDEKQQELLVRLGVLTQKQFDNKRASGGWGDISVASLSYGYGQLTKMQNLLQGIATVVDGGREMSFTDLKSVNGTGGKQLVDPRYSELIKRLMLTNVTHRYGTATKAYRVGTILGGKTATSKYHIAATPERKAHYSHETRASFFGVFPMDDPQYIIGVTLFKPVDENQKPLNGGYIAAPIVGAIAERIAVKEGILRSPEFTKQFEEGYALPYIHPTKNKKEVVRVSSN